MNAKKELLRAIKGHTILCGEIFKENWDDTGEEMRKDVGSLKECYSEEDEKKFWKALDFEYDEGYGGQNLFGLIWLVNGVWLERGEYDGSEWWIWQQLPEIPSNLRSLKNKLKKL